MERSLRYAPLCIDQRQLVSRLEECWPTQQEGEIQSSHQN